MKLKAPFSECWEARADTLYAVELHQVKIAHLVTALESYRTQSDDHQTQPLNELTAQLINLKARDGNAVKKFTDAPRFPRTGVIASRDDYYSLAVSSLRLQNPSDSAGKNVTTWLEYQIAGKSTGNNEYY